MKKNERGQIAIFAVLVFQVFFVLFAMVIQVGLLVHHKINLQNSADLAAYYAAMKQAEVLNAMSHVNYQIRQSWKLLNFRYRGIGMAGNQGQGSPLFCSKNYDLTCTARPPTFPPGVNIQSPFASAIPAQSNCVNSFCTSHFIFRNFNANETYCNANCVSPNAIMLPGITQNVSAGAALFAGFTPGALASLIALESANLTSTLERCRLATKYNFLLLGTFIHNFKWDVRNRRDVIEALGQMISESESDFVDIDGGRAREGILNNLKRNLTQPNLESLDLNNNPNAIEFYNGLGHASCRNNQWLQPIFVRIAYRYLEMSCGTTGNTIGKQHRLYDDNFLKLDSNPGDYPNALAIRTEYPDFFESLKYAVVEPENYDVPEQTRLASMVGYEKNPWCLPYVKVRLESEPKIPFSPIKVKLKAESYAKAFGGRMGPWYRKKWDANQKVSGDSQTMGAEKLDINLPVRGDNRTQDAFAKINQDYLNNPDDVTNRLNYESMFPNHSRFLGDPVGNRAYSTVEAWNDAIFFTTLPPPGVPNPQDSKFSANHWLGNLSTINDMGDILSWDYENKKPAPSRPLEVQSIIPNQFDLAFYQIEPNFFYNYATRLRKNQNLLSRIKNDSRPEIKIRGDLGYRSDESDLRDMTLEKQLLQTKDKPLFAFKQGPSRLPHREIAGLGYLMKVLDVENAKLGQAMLTSWHMATPGDYPFSTSRFANCEIPFNPTGAGAGSKEQEATPGQCFQGGRNTYSVRLFNPELFSNDIEAGGKGVRGKFKNPPPPNP